MPHKSTQLGDDRRAHILDLLKNSKEPIKAAELAKTTGVSRQVIVQDMNLLRAKDEPVMATPQGYVYFSVEPSGIREVIFSKHSLEATEQELNILVDHGVKVLNVGVEHSVYGKIFRPLDLKTRLDVKKFIAQIQENEANLLCSLTNGLHVHTIEASSREIIEQACRELARQGFLVTKQEDQGLTL